MALLLLAYNVQLIKVTLHHLASDIEGDDLSQLTSLLIKKAGVLVI